MFMYALYLSPGPAGCCCVQIGRKQLGLRSSFWFSENNKYERKLHKGDYYTVVNPTESRKGLKFNVLHTAI